jgi:hypothetical protein
MRSKLGLLWGRRRCAAGVPKVRDLETSGAGMGFRMPQVRSMLPPFRLCKEDTNSDRIEFVKPTSQNAAILRRPAVQIGSPYGSIALAKLQMHFGMRAVRHDGL